MLHLIGNMAPMDLVEEFMKNNHETWFTINQVGEELDLSKKQIRRALTGLVYRNILHCKLDVNRNVIQIYKYNPRHDEEWF